MDFYSGTVEVGTDPVLLCNVPESGVLLKNLGGTAVYLGGKGVGAPEDDAAAGFPLEPGGVQTISGLASTPRPAPIVPAPPSDTNRGLLELYARSGRNASSKVSWILIG
jgi:hypothetical protein